MKLPSAMKGSECVHARSVNERGQIVPRCSAHRKTMKNIADMMVTADVRRINCGACKVAIS